jgi:hypothetical protein
MTPGHLLSPPPYSGSTPNALTISAALAPAASVTSAVSVTPAATTTPFKEQLMTLLGIPLHLSNRSDRNLCVIYETYKAHLQASQTLRRMVSEGTWPGKKPSATDLIELFTSKSMWFSHYKPALSKVSDYPEMVKWLENSDEKGSDLEVWGVEKGSYYLVDLRKFVDNGTLAERKVKGKRKEKDDLVEGSAKKAKKKGTSKVGVKDSSSFKKKQT